MDEDLSFKRHRLSWADPVQVGAHSFAVDHILAKLGNMLTPERIQRLDQVASERSLQLTAVLENIYDRGNVSAVMRSFEAFGFARMHLIDQPGGKFKAANRVTKGAEKWLDIQSHNDPLTAVASIKKQGYQIWATDLNTQRSIADIDWSRPVAIVLGNEKDGVSETLKSAVDGTFRVPMVGFSQSFNISVAAALIFYHARQAFGARADAWRVSDAEKRQILANYYLRCFDNPEKLLSF